MLEGKKIVLGVTGGIAAYKAVEVASRLRKKGAEVHVIMTRAATEFVTELTFREITGQPVRDVPQLRALLEKAGKNVALLIERENARIFVPVELG